MSRKKIKSLPRPRIATVRFQVSMRGVKFRTLAEAREDFEGWLDTGESEAGAGIKIHIWQNERERIIEELGHEERGEKLREVIRGALRSGRLQIRATRKNRK